MEEEEEGILGPSEQEKADLFQLLQHQQRSMQLIQESIKAIERGNGPGDNGNTSIAQQHHLSDLPLLYPLRGKHTIFIYHICLLLFN